MLAQAPDDFDTVCRTDPNLAPDHVFPTDLRLLLDSFDYNSLYGDESPRPSASNPWETRSFDGDDGAAENNNNVSQQFTAPSTLHGSEKNSSLLAQVSCQNTTTEIPHRLILVGILSGNHVCVCMCVLFYDNQPVALYCALAQ